MKEFAGNLFMLALSVGFAILVVSGIRWVWNYGTYWNNRQIEIDEVICEDQYTWKEEQLNDCRIKLDVYKKLCKDNQ